MTTDTSIAAKACPDCAENVEAVDAVCRFCGHRFGAQPALPGVATMPATSHGTPTVGRAVSSLPAAAAVAPWVQQPWGGRRNPPIAAGSEARPRGFEPLTFGSVGLGELEVRRVGIAGMVQRPRRVEDRLELGTRFAQHRRGWLGRVREL